MLQIDGLNVINTHRMTAIKRILHPSPKYSFFLFGPRGTGKSTWVRSAFPHAHNIDLLDESTFRSFSAAPERLLDIVRALPSGTVILLDEIQRLPVLLNLVHKLIEEKGGWVFVLTGSSARKLKRSGVDLLAGRARLNHMHPFMAAELGAAFRLNDSLQRGLLPLVWDATDPAHVLESYVGLYLKEEVQQEGLVRQVGNFSRFLEVMAFSHSQPINFSSLAREAECKRSTVVGYAGILEDLLLSFSLPVFTRRARRHLADHPKFFYFDVGVFRSLRRRGPLDRPEEIEGQALEGLVAQHLRAWNDYSREKHDLSFWRTRAGVEVDFVVYGPSGIWALEVKNTGRVRPEDLRGLHAFRTDYPQARTVFLYRGPDKLRQNGIDIVPCELFLRSLLPNKPVLPA
jgi:predicted AAA+ superfamily ATPase